MRPIFCAPRVKAYVHVQLLVENSLSALNNTKNIIKNQAWLTIEMQDNQASSKMFEIFLKGFLHFSLLKKSIVKTQRNSTQLN